MSEMKLGRFLCFMCLTDTKILKCFHDFPKPSMLASCPNLNPSDMSNASSLTVARKTVLWNSLGSLLSLLATGFPFWLRHPLDTLVLMVKEHLLCIACFAWWITSRGKTKFFSHRMTSFQCSSGICSLPWSFLNQWTLLTPCSVVEHEVNQTEACKRCLSQFLVRQQFFQVPSHWSVHQWLKSRLMHIKCPKNILMHYTTDWTVRSVISGVLGLTWVSWILDWAVRSVISGVLGLTDWVDPWLGSEVSDQWCFGIDGLSGSLTGQWGQWSVVFWDWREWAGSLTGQWGQWSVVFWDWRTEWILDWAVRSVISGVLGLTDWVDPWLGSEVSDQWFEDGHGWAGRCHLYCGHRLCWNGSFRTSLNTRPTGS